MRLKVVWVIVVVGIMAVVNMYGQKEDGMKERISLEKVKTFEGAYRPYAGYFSPDGTKLALRDDEKVWIVEVETGKALCELKALPDRTGGIFVLAFTRDWKKFAISFLTSYREKPHWDDLFDDRYKIKVILVETSTCKEIKTLYHKEGKGTRLDLSFFRDGKKLALVRGFLRIIDVESGEDETVYEMDSFPKGYRPRKNALSSDGRWLVVYTTRSGSPRNFPALYVMDLKSGERRLLSKNGEINEIKFSRDSKLLVASSFVKDYDKKGFIGYERVKAKVYEVGSWKLLRTFEESGEVFDISPNNKLLATGHWGEEKGKIARKGIIRIYSLETGEKLEEKCHYKRTLWDDLVEASNAITMIHHIEFSADGKMLATGGFDSSVKLWRVERVKEKKKERSWWRKIFRDER